jgi:histidine triad (HIT) family protein
LQTRAGRKRGPARPRTFSIPRERPEGGVADPNQNPTCVFCRIIGGDETVSIIHEDEEVIAFLDVQPLHRGHVLVVPKAHYKNLFYVPEELATRTFAVAKRILPGCGAPRGAARSTSSPPTGRTEGRTSSTSTCT